MIQGDQRVTVKVFAAAVTDQFIGSACAFPTLVAIHRVITTDEGTEFPHPQGTHAGQRPMQGFSGAARRRVPSIQESMQADFAHPLTRRQGHAFQEKVLVPMHAPGGQQADEMQHAVILDGPAADREQHGVGSEAAILDGARDARKLLVDDASRAQVHMPHLGVAHLRRRQSHLQAGGVQQHVRSGAPKPIPVRLTRTVNGVVFGGLCIAPAIQNNQQQRPVEGGETRSGGSAQKMRLRADEEEYTSWDRVDALCPGTGSV